MDKFIEYAPTIVVLFGFFIAYKVFVTPEQMSEKFMSFEQHLENKFVLQQTYDVAITEIKSDNQEIKEKLDKIYDKLMTV
jgi:hypothetical protein